VFELFFHSHIASLFQDNDDPLNELTIGGDNMLQLRGRFRWISSPTGRPMKGHLQAPTFQANRYGDLQWHTM